MIKRFSPFLAVEEFNDIIYRYTFKCPHCGSDSCVKLDDFDKFVFWSGFYMCSKCGMSVFHKKEFNYYHDCFVRVNTPVQLSLFV